MSFIEKTSSLTNKVILTNFCSKSNEKVQFVKTGDDLDIEIRDCGFESKNLANRFSLVLRDIFLPKGYPESVSDDYLEYQIWDTCQAFCSSVSATFSMQAVMKGIGVGSGTATPVSAAVTWLMKDGTGMIGSILFAWLKGSKLDSDCKKWRLFADILNDIAMFVELYVPSFPDYSMYLLCLATAFKALVGTAGSSTRAAIITHQAVNENIADVSAKDGSQEIFVNLCAFLFGIFLLKTVTDTDHIWVVVCTATFFHLIFNYKAVKCLRINVFNSERFRLCLRTYIPTSTVPTVAQINKNEPVFLLMGTSDSHLCGYTVNFGTSLKKVVESQQITEYQLTAITSLFQDRNYLIIVHDNKKKLVVSFRQSFKEVDVIKAYFHAIFLGIALTYLQGNNDNLKVLLRSRFNSPMERFKHILEEINESNFETPEYSVGNAIILKAYMSCEELIEQEFSNFTTLCSNENNWNLNKHLITIDDWRADWNVKKRKKSDTRESSSSDKAMIGKKKSSKPKPIASLRNLIIS